MTDKTKSVDEIARKLEEDRRKEAFENHQQELKPVEITPLPETVVDVSFLDVAVNWFKASVATSFLNQYEGKEMNIQDYIVKFIVQYLGHIGGGVLLTLGISIGSWTEIIGAGVAFLVGTISHLISHNNALNTDPKKLR